MVHGNFEGVDTAGNPCVSIPVPNSFFDMIPTASPDEHGLEWFLAVAVHYPQPVALSFQTITFGVGAYDPQTCYIVAYGPCRQDLNPQEIPSDGWPGPVSGTAVAWIPGCLEGDAIPVYYFGVYAYSEGSIPLGGYYPSLDAEVTSCEEPVEADPITFFGEMQCGGHANAIESSTWGRIKVIYR
jgi:hypothetical protein